ncbi:unnamed protein product [Oikopleura dioica]|uniref:PDZ domain-containing protein n=1 Tax=Oikopleura dioica TaxID=34765 RepID=E4XMP9_OIKDI|nr:unnamed protein product [Oikopleura dioica]
MNHHESKSRIIRESSFDSITDELANRNRVSSTSSDTDIKFFISGESDEEETITPTGNLQQPGRDLVSRRFSNSSESDCAPVRALLSQDRFRHLSVSCGRRVPKSASTSSIPESRLIIPNDFSADSHPLIGRSIQVHSSNPSSRDSSPNRCASPLLGDTRHIKIRTVRNRADSLVGKRLKNKARDIGFLLSTIPVYIGSSNNYTLHHIVSKVSPESEADKAGLRAMDLITHVNGEIIQGCLNTEVLNLIHSEGDELTLSVIPLDSTAIAIQQQKTRRTGKLIRRYRRTSRLKSNRSSTARQSFSKLTPNPLTRSRSFTSRSSRRSPIGSERPSPRLSPVSFAEHSLSNISVPSDVSSGRTSPRQKRSQRKQFPKFTNTISFKDKSPLAAGQHLPLSPLARTPSPGPERFQSAGPQRCQSWAPLSASGRSSPTANTLGHDGPHFGHRNVMRRRASLASCPEGRAYIEKAFYECEDTDLLPVPPRLTMSPSQCSSHSSSATIMPRTPKSTNNETK